jgi:hypothetical protein
MVYFSILAVLVAILKAIWFLAQVLAPSDIAFIFLPARAYLVVESFRTVFSLPLRLT